MAIDIDDYFQEEPGLAETAPTPQPSSGYNRDKNNQSGYKKPYNPNFKPKEVDLATFKLYKPYTIMGTKDAPREIIDKAKELYELLNKHEFTLRTSCSSEIENELRAMATQDSSEIYIPWKDFDSIDSKHYFNDKVVQHVAKMFHRTFDTLKPAAQAFLGRNVRVVLGDKLRSYSLFVVVWSEDGVEQIKDITFKTGYVSHVISVARTVHIPVFNLQNPGIIDRISKFLKL